MDLIWLLFLCSEAADVARLLLGKNFLKDDGNCEYLAENKKPATTTTMEP
jgi:hypothetical protein